MKEPKLSFKHSESIASIFLCLSEFLISRGSRGIITTLAFWHCGRHYLYYQRWKHILCYNLFEKFKLLSCLSMFWILPCHPEFHNLTYYDLKKNKSKYQGTYLSLILKNHQYQSVILLLPQKIMFFNFFIPAKFLISWNSNKGWWNFHWEFAKNQLHYINRKISSIYQ